MAKYKTKPATVEATVVKFKTIIELENGEQLTGLPGDYLVTDATGEHFMNKADFESVYVPTKKASAAGGRPKLSPEEKAARKLEKQKAKEGRKPRQENSAAAQ